MGSESLLTIAKSEATSKHIAIPNLLPCRVHHTGPVDPIAGYWTPSDSKQVAYFRGRKLHGRPVAISNDYQGLVVQREKEKENKKEERKPLEEEKEEEEEEEQRAETETLQVKARFDKFLVWTIEASTDTTTDEYVRGMEEWLLVADKIHSFAERGGGVGE